MQPNYNTDTASPLNSPLDVLKGEAGGGDPKKSKINVLAPVKHDKKIETPKVQFNTSTLDPANLPNPDILVDTPTSKVTKIHEQSYPTSEEVNQTLQGNGTQVENPDNTQITQGTEQSVLDKITKPDLTDNSVTTLGKQTLDALKDIPKHIATIVNPNELNPAEKFNAVMSLVATPFTIAGNVPFLKPTNEMIGAIVNPFRKSLDEIAPENDPISVSIKDAMTNATTGLLFSGLDLGIKGVDVPKLIDNAKTKIDAIPDIIKTPENIQTMVTDMVKNFKTLPEFKKEIITQEDVKPSDLTSKEYQNPVIDLGGEKPVAKFNEQKVPLTDTEKTNEINKIRTNIFEDVKKLEPDTQRKVYQSLQDFKSIDLNAELDKVQSTKGAELQDAIQQYSKTREINQQIQDLKTTIETPKTIPPLEIAKNVIPKVDLTKVGNETPVNEKPIKIPEITPKEPVSNIDNWVKQQDNLEIKVKDNLGVNPEGKKIGAYYSEENGKGIINVTKDTPESTIIHEAGHYIQKKLGDKIEQFKPELQKYAPDQNLNEAFSNALKDVVTNPDIQAKLPKMTQFAKDIGLPVEDIKKKENLSFSTENTATRNTVKSGKKIVNEPIAEKVSDTGIDEKYLRKQRYSEDLIAKIKQQAQPVETNKLQGKIIEKPVPVENNPNAEKVKFVEKSPKGVSQSVKAIEGTKPLETKSYNLDKMQSYDDVEKQIVQTLSDKNNEFRDQRRGTQSIDLSKDLANSLGITTKDLEHLRAGDIKNREWVVGARQVVADMTREFREHLKTVGDKPTQEQKIEIMQKANKLVGSMKAIAGLRSEAGRLLESYNHEISPREFSLLDDTIAQLKTIDKESAGNLAEFSKKVNEAMTNPTKKDKALYAWYNVLLLNPSSDLAHTLGTGSHIVLEALSKSISDPKNFVSMWKGVARGFKEGNKQAMQILKTGDASTKSLFLDFPKYKEVFQPKSLVGKLFKDILPTTRHALEDAYLRNIIKGMKIEPMAKSFGMNAKTFTDAMDKAMAIGNKENELYKAGKEIERYVDFVSFREPFKSKAGKSFQGLADTNTGRFFLLPFTKIPINLLRVGLDYSPLGAFKKLGYDRIINKEWYQELTKNERGDIIRRSIAGTVFLTAMGSLMASGKVEVTGQLSENPDERDLLQKQGYEPNSIYINLPDGKKYGVSYQHIAGLNIMLGLIGNYADHIKYSSEKQLTKEQQESFLHKASNTLFGTAKTFLDNSFLRSAKDILNEITKSDPEGLDKAIANFVPNGRGMVRSIEKVLGSKLDETQYNTPELWDKVKLKLGITGGLVPRYNALGDTKTSQARLPFFPHSVDKSDPLYSYLLDNKIIPSTPKSLKLKGKDATKEELSIYQKDSGERLNKSLRDNLDNIKKFPKESPDGTQHTQDDAVKEIERIVHEESKDKMEKPDHILEIDTKIKDYLKKQATSKYKKEIKKIQ